MENLNGGCHFVLELVVTKVEVGRYASHRQKLANAVIGFKFIRFPNSMVVTDKDFTEDDDFKGHAGGAYSRGKSCCFKLNSYCPTRAKIKIDVRRRLLDLAAQQDDGLIRLIPSSAFATIRVGAIALNVGGAMAQILVQSASTGYATPICKLITKSFPLKNESKIPTGAVTLQIRIACFGRMCFTSLKSLLCQSTDTLSDEMAGGDMLRDLPSRRFVTCMPITMDRELTAFSSDTSQWEDGREHKAIEVREVMTQSNPVIGRSDSMKSGNRIQGEKKKIDKMTGKNKVNRIFR